MSFEVVHKKKKITFHKSMLNSCRHNLTTSFGGNRISYQTSSKSSRKMQSSPPFPPLQPPTASLPFVSIIALILIYVAISYLIIEFIDDNEHRVSFDIEHGLSMQDTEAIPWFDYEGITSTMSCVICLDCFWKGDRCKKLPICNHIFHAHCIDLWLVRKLTCPTCRSPLKIKVRLNAV
ncbi:RING-H2 finger protein ATL14-like [Mercurialis annua]|uniref:RING-H2 finger protein ATL14-like n=1 Tax=Mercurialis annua TaxID=3986 RepID=UPI00215E936C|nr:RING-H2 finger protein ATL14-like [Mercurialis annua]